MRLTHGSQTIQVLEGKRFIKSAVIGMTSKEELRWLSENLITNMRDYREDGWGYIADISKMSPVTPDISKELVEFHRRIADAGCKAYAFVVFGSYVLTAQAKNHQKKSGAPLQEGYFQNEVEAMEWLSHIL